MIFDSQAIFSSAQALAAVAGSDVISTNYLDTGNVYDEGIGEVPRILVRTKDAVTSGGAATVQFILQTATDSAFTSPQECPLTGVRALAALGANTVQFNGPPPTGLLRYWRVVARVAGANTTGGTMDAELVATGDATQYVPKNFTAD